MLRLRKLYRAAGLPQEGSGLPDHQLAPLWSSGRLYAKAVTVFTDEPERMAPDSVLHPIYDVLYRWQR